MYRYTKNYIAMKDGEIGVVRASDTTLDISRVQVNERKEGNKIEKIANFALSIF
jgi:hypothetical protein